MAIPSLEKKRHKWPKSWSSIEEPLVLLERNLYGHPLAGLLRGRKFEEALSELGWEIVPNCECDMWMTLNGWKEAEYGSHVEEIDEKR